MKNILIVEDDERISHLEQDYLIANGYNVDTAYDGETGLAKALDVEYDLVLLDIMLPRMDGLEVCKRIREEKEIPILLVSAKKDDLDKIKGLGYGADDYIVKPFSPSELVARIASHINRYERLTKPKTDGAPQSIIEIGNLVIDNASRRVCVADKEISMTNKEFDLLYFLASSPDTVFSKEELFGNIWKYDPIGETSTVTVHINRIRDKIKEIDPDMECIHTVWGRGYRFN